MSTGRLLLQQAERLARLAAAADAATRIRLQPELTRLVERMRIEGIRVSARLQRIEAELADEAIEARFDNMPV